MTTWSITNLERVLNNGFVLIAHWTCTGSQDGQSARVYNTQSFPYDPNEPGFIPYDQLTEAEVIGWVQTAMGPEGVAAIEATVQQQLNQLINPVVANGLPWAPPAPTPIPVPPMP